MWSPCLPPPPLSLSLSLTFRERCSGFARLSRNFPRALLYIRVAYLPALFTSDVAPPSKGTTCLHYAESTRGGFSRNARVDTPSRLPLSLSLSLSLSVCPARGSQALAAEEASAFVSR